MTQVRIALAMSQVALALTLLSGAGLLIKTLSKLETVNLGFDPSNLIVTNLRLPPVLFADIDERRALVNRLKTGLSGLPGVEGVTYGPSPLLNLSGYFVARSRIPGEHPALNVGVRRVDADYFRVYGIRLLSGRALRTSDSSGVVPAVVLNDVAARLLFPNQNPIGQTLPDLLITRGPAPKIVGVASSVVQSSVSVPAGPEAYVSVGQVESFSFIATLTVRTRHRLAIEEQIRRVIAEVDSRVAPETVTSMTELLERSSGTQRFLARLLATFAVVALLIVSTGLYAVLQDSVVHRLTEFAVRSALGASPLGIASSVLRQTLVIVTGGVIVSVPLVLSFASLTEVFFYSVPERDVAVFTLSLLALLVTAVAATIPPAYRAITVAPMTALRGE